LAVEYRRPRWSDVKRIGRLMAPMDALECRAMGREPRAALEAGFYGSTLCWTAVVDGKAQAMFGVAPISVLDGKGSPWFLGTEEARTMGRAFMREAPAFVTTMQRFYPSLENWVHQDNRRSRRWLARLGFHFGVEAVHFGNEPMIRFFKG
jgi:hypothetical protein